MNDFGFEVNGFCLSEMFRFDSETHRPVVVGMFPPYLPFDNFPVFFPVLYGSFEAHGLVMGKESCCFDFSIQDESGALITGARFRVRPTPYPSIVAFRIDGPIPFLKPGKYACCFRRITESGDVIGEWREVKSFILDKKRLPQGKDWEKLEKKVMEMFLKAQNDEER